MRMGNRSNLVRGMGCERMGRPQGKKKKRQFGHFARQRRRYPPAKGSIQKKEMLVWVPKGTEREGGFGIGRQSWL